MESNGPFLQRSEYFIQCVLTDTLDALGRQYLHVPSLLDDAHFFEFVDEIFHRHILIEETILLCKLLQPFQRFLNITAVLDQEIAEQGHQTLQPLFVGH